MSNNVIDLTNDGSDEDVVHSDPKEPKTNGTASRPSPSSGHSRNEPIDLTEDDPVIQSSRTGVEVTPTCDSTTPKGSTARSGKSRSRSRQSAEAMRASRSGTVEESPQPPSSNATSSASDPSELELRHQDIANPWARLEKELRYQDIAEAWAKQKKELLDDHARNVQVSAEFSKSSLITQWYSEVLLQRKDFSSAKTARNSDHSQISFSTSDSMRT